MEVEVEVEVEVEDELVLDEDVVADDGEVEFIQLVSPD